MWPNIEIPEPTLSEQLAKIQAFGITASPVQKKKIRAKRVRWGEEETREMLTLYESFTLMHSTSADVKSQADVCRSVEIEMRLKGYDKSWHQVKDRYTNLRVVYLKSQGMQRSACIGMNSASEFFDQISRIVDLEGKHIRIRRTGEGLTHSSVYPSPLKVEDSANNNSEDSFHDENDGTKVPSVHTKQEFSKDSTIAVPNPEIQSVLHAALMKRKRKGLSTPLKEDISVSSLDPVINQFIDDVDELQSFPDVDVSNNNDSSRLELCPRKKRRKKKVIVHSDDEQPASPGDLCQVLIESPVPSLSDYYTCGDSLPNEYFVSDEVTMSEVSSLPSGKNSTLNRPKKQPRAANMEQLVDYLRNENLRLRSENQLISNQYRSLASTIVTISYLRTMQELALKPAADTLLDLD